MLSLCFHYAFIMLSLCFHYAFIMLLLLRFDLRKTSNAIFCRLYSLRVSQQSRLYREYADRGIELRLRYPFVVATTSTIITPLTIHPQPSYALVKGNTPPPKKKPSTPTTTSSDNQGGVTDGSQSQPMPKCRNVEECQEMAERLADVEARQDAERAANSRSQRLWGWVVVPNI